MSTCKGLVQQSKKVQSSNSNRINTKQIHNITDGQISTEHTTFNIKDKNITDKERQTNRIEYN